MSASTESSVRNYLVEFDRLSAQLPKQRRDILRSQIEDHLRGAIPANATEAEVGAALAGFGSPEEIISQELESDSATSQAAPPKKRRLLIWGAVALAVVAAGLIWLFVAPLAFILQ